MLTDLGGGESLNIIRARLQKDNNPDHGMWWCLLWFRWSDVGCFKGSTLKRFWRTRVRSVKMRAIMNGDFCCCLSGASDEFLFGLVWAAAERAALKVVVVLLLVVGCCCSINVWWPKAALKADDAESPPPLQSSRCWWLLLLLFLPLDMASKQ